MRVVHLVVSTMVAVVLLLAVRASAQCPAVIESWTTDCEASSGLDVRLRACHPDGFVVEVHSKEGSVLDVDVTRARPEAFRRVGELSVAPIGDFADWSREPPPRQRSLDDVTDCVRRAPPPMDLLAPGSWQGGPDLSGAVATVMPWLPLALLASAVVRALFLLRGPRMRPGQLRAGALVAALSLATFAIRWVTVAHAFFHQNGQGPGWVDAAWRRVPGSYGPGYAELYGWIAARSPEAPEGAVFLANACAGAALPALAYALARRASASRQVAGGVAVALALAPIGARLAQSESYYLPMTFMLFVAALALADAARTQVRPAALIADVAVAALAIAQAARIHPIAWVPAATTPLVMLVAAPSLRRAMGRAAAATTAVALGVLVFAGRVIWDVMHGSLGHAWGPMAGRVAGETSATSIVWVAVTAGLLALAWRGRATKSRFTPLAMLAVVLGIAVQTDLVGGDLPVVHPAYAGLYAPVVVAMIASGASAWVGVLVRRPALRELACGLGLVTCGAIFALATARVMSTLPTDAREQSWVLEWRRSLPRDAIVCWYGHAGRRMIDMPLYRNARMPRAIRLEEGVGPAERDEAYYVHTSLCASDEGRGNCERFEASHRLVPVERRVLPAIQSMPSLGFAAPTVEVVLYRVGP